MAYLAQLAGLVSLSSVCILFPNLIMLSSWLFIAIADDITKDSVAFNVAIHTSNGNYASSTDSNKTLGGLDCLKILFLVELYIELMKFFHFFFSNSTVTYLYAILNKLKIYLHCVN